MRLIILIAFFAIPNISWSQVTLALPDYMATTKMNELYLQNNSTGDWPGQSWSIDETDLSVPKTDLFIANGTPDFFVGLSTEELGKLLSRWGTSIDAVDTVKLGAGYSANDKDLLLIAPDTTSVQLPLIYGMKNPGSDNSAVTAGFLEELFLQNDASVEALLSLTQVPAINDLSPNGDIFTIRYPMSEDGDGCGCDNTDGQLMSCDPDDGYKMMGDLFGNGNNDVPTIEYVATETGSEYGVLADDECPVCSNPNWRFAPSPESLPDILLDMNSSLRGISDSSSQYERLQRIYSGAEAMRNDNMAILVMSCDPD